MPSGTFMLKKTSSLAFGFWPAMLGVMNYRQSFNTTCQIWQGGQCLYINIISNYYSNSFKSFCCGEQRYTLSVFINLNTVVIGYDIKDIFKVFFFLTTSMNQASLTPPISLLLELQNDSKDCCLSEGRMWLWGTMLRCIYFKCPASTALTGGTDVSSWRDTLNSTISHVTMGSIYLLQHCAMSLYGFIFFLHLRYTTQPK